MSFNKSYIFCSRKIIHLNIRASTPHILHNKQCQNAHNVQSCFIYHGKIIFSTFLLFSAGVVAPDWIAKQEESKEEGVKEEEGVEEEDTRIGYCKTHNNFSYLSEIQILVFSVSLIALLFISLLSILSKLKFLIV